MKKWEEIFCAVLVGFLLGISAFLYLNETIWKRTTVVVPYAYAIPCAAKGD